MNHLNKIKKYTFLVFVLLLITTFITTNIFCLEEPKKIQPSLFKDKFSLGISIEETTIPLLRTKLRITNNTYAEVRFGVANEMKGEDLVIGIFLYGARFYNTLKFQNTNTKLTYTKLYWGIETDYLNVLHTSIELGKGYVIGSFIGAEKFLFKNLTLNLDIGPYYLYIKHPIFDKEVNSVDIIFNLMFNYYLW